MTDIEKPAHEFVLVSEFDDLLTAQCRALRINVFVDEQKFPADAEIDECAYAKEIDVSTKAPFIVRYDEPGRSIHILLRLLPSNEPLGTVRLVVALGKVGRLCILPPYRKFGFGRDLMNHCHETARSKYGLKKAQLHSQVPVISFYERYAQLTSLYVSN